MHGGTCGIRTYIVHGRGIDDHEKKVLAMLNTTPKFVKVVAPGEFVTAHKSSIVHKRIFYFFHMHDEMDVHP